MGSSKTIVAQVNNNYHWVVLSILTISQLVMSMGAYVWGPLAPELRDSFELSRAQIGSITSALYFASVIVAIPSGIAVDRLGARVLLIFSLATMGLSFALMIFAKNYIYFIVFASVSGIGYGMINQVSTKGIMYWFSSKLRATAMGIKQTGVTFGGAIIAILLPILSTIYDWRLGVFVVGILMLLTAIISLIFYREKPEVISTYKSTLTASRSRKVEKGALKKVMSNPVLLILCILTPLLAMGQICITSFLLLYLEEDLSFSVGLAGACLTVTMIAGTAGRIGWGVISDRLFAGDRIKPVIILTLIAFISAFGMAFLTKSSPVWISFFLSILMGSTLIGWNAVLITLAAELAGQELAGSIMGILLTTTWTGIIIGPPVFGFIADRSGYFWGWLMISILALLCAFGFAYVFYLAKKMELMKS